MTGPSRCGPTQSPVLIRTMRTPAGYSLKAVLHNGTDVTDTGIAFKPGETVTGLQVVLSTTSSGVAGSVTDDSGRPVADYAVIVFAEDSTRWGFMSRHVAMARPDQQGGFQAKNLPPGRYLAVAVEAVEEGQETDPEFLERLRPLGTAFTLGEGEQRSVALKIVQAVLMTDVNHRDTEARRTHRVFLGTAQIRNLRVASVFSVAPWLTDVIIRPIRARPAASGFPSVSA